MGQCSRSIGDVCPTGPATESVAPVEYRRAVRGAGVRGRGCQQRGRRLATRGRRTASRGTAREKCGPRREYLPQRAPGGEDHFLDGSGEEDLTHSAQEITPPQRGDCFGAAPSTSRPHTCHGRLSPTSHVTSEILPKQRV
eukprot:scaffold2404_cov398-Prasinococcus_capsulatus_cf.AAC.39